MRSFPISLRSLALRLLTQGPLKTYPAAPRRIRIVLGGQYIADTTSALYVWEHDKYPFFYVPKKDTYKKEEVKWSLLDEIKAGEGGTEDVGAKIWKIEAGNGGRSTDRVVEFLKGKLEGLVRFEFGAVDQWFEEDTPVLVHPKDPFKRITCLPSTRPIHISLNNHALAHSPYSVHLYETDLPCRFYIPMTSIPQEYLRPSSTTSLCPYKGQAEYFDVVVPAEEEGGKEEVYRDLVWYYNRPNVEVAAVQGLACFFNEKVDIEIGGEKLERPKTHFA